VLFWVPRFRLEVEISELGLACVAGLPWHHAVETRNDSEYRLALGPVNRNRTRDL